MTHPTQLADALTKDSGTLASYTLFTMKFPSSAITFTFSGSQSSKVKDLTLL